MSKFLKTRAKDEAHFPNWRLDRVKFEVEHPKLELHVMNNYIPRPEHLGQRAGQDVVAEGTLGQGNQFSLLSSPEQTMTFKEVLEHCSALLHGIIEVQ